MHGAFLKNITGRCQNIYTTYSTCTVKLEPYYALINNCCSSVALVVQILAEYNYTTKSGSGTSRISGHASLDTSIKYSFHSVKRNGGADGDEGTQRGGLIGLRVIYSAR